MMATHEGNNKHNSHSKRVPSTPVKWTLVEAEPETPEARRSKQQGYGRSRGQSGGSSSGPGGNWRPSRDGGRGRGGGHHFANGPRGGRRGGKRSNQGHGRGRGYAASNYVGATYYGGVEGYLDPCFEQQKAYMTNLAVRQIEFYFTVENLCRDIFMRSYMDEEGYIPIAFVANFPGVARFGVELQDIVAGVRASEMLQVDVENETMRMREGWKVWLLPNQATGGRGVPRYIKIGPPSMSEPSTGQESNEANPRSQEIKCFTYIFNHGSDELHSEDLRWRQGDLVETSAEHDGEFDESTETNEAATQEAAAAAVEAATATATATTGATMGATKANGEGGLTSPGETAETAETAETPVYPSAPVVEKSIDIGMRIERKVELTPTAPVWTPSTAKGSGEGGEGDARRGSGVVGNDLSATIDGSECMEAASTSNLSNEVPTSEDRTSVESSEESRDERIVEHGPCAGGVEALPPDVST